MWGLAQRSHIQHFLERSYRVGPGWPAPQDADAGQLCTAVLPRVAAMVSMCEEVALLSVIAVTSDEVGVDAPIPNVKERLIARWEA